MSMKIVIKLRLLWLGGAVLMLPSLARAESGHTTVEAVIARALNDSPSVREITARIVHKRSVGIEAKTFGNPTLDAELRSAVSSENTGDSNEVAVSLSQPLRPSDFGARDRVNTLIQQAADTEEQLELLGFSQRIKLSFAKTWALSRRAKEIEKYLARAKKIEQAVNRASESGYISPGERAIFKAEALKAKYQLGAVLSDLKRARAELSKAAGFPVPELLTPPDLGPELAGVPGTEKLLQNSQALPVRARARLAVKLAREQLKLADLDAYPKFAPRLVYERTNDAADFVGVGFSIELPIFNRNQASRGVQAAELEAAQSLERYFSGEDFATEILARRSGLEASMALLAGYEKEILPALREAVLAEEGLLSSGQGSMFRVWQSLRELSLVEAETVERMIGVIADRSELAILTGIDF